MDESDTVLDVGHDDATRTTHHDGAPGEAGRPPASAAASGWPHLSATARRAGVGNPLRVRL